MLPWTRRARIIARPDGTEERMRSMLVIGTVLGVIGLSSAALAEETAKKVAPGRYEIHVDIVVKRPMPMAAIDVAKIPMKTTLSPLKQPLVGRIEQAIEKSPF
jgi:hypothetical protein